MKLLSLETSRGSVYNAELKQIKNLFEKKIGLLYTKINNSILSHAKKQEIAQKWDIERWKNNMKEQLTD